MGPNVVLTKKNIYVRSMMQCLLISTEHMMQCLLISTEHMNRCKQRAARSWIPGIMYEEALKGNLDKQLIHGPWKNLLNLENCWQTLADKLDVSSWVGSHLPSRRPKSSLKYYTIARNCCFQRQPGYQRISTLGFARISKFFVVTQVTAFQETAVNT